MLPNLIRVKCTTLAEFVTYDDIEGLCKSSLFFGNGPLTQSFSVLLMVNTFIVSLPLYTFFVSTILGSLRHQSCSKTYGLLARVDPFSPTVDKCPIIDMTVYMLRDKSLFVSVVCFYYICLFYSIICYARL